MESLNISLDDFRETIRDQKERLQPVETRVTHSVVTFNDPKNINNAKNNIITKDEEPIRLLASDITHIHGFLSDVNWTSPRMTKFCDDEARPGYSTTLAHEYEDEENVLREKIRLMADLLRKSKACVAYTGAGLSTSSGIADYASKDSNRTHLLSPLQAKPSYGHHALTALCRNNLVHEWIQQNHDGLPQKAGLAQHMINEIHGAWYDPSNPVVVMSGSLRGDLFERLLEWEMKCDLAISVGTSMSGMNADRVFTTVSAKAKKNNMRAKSDESIGGIIIGLQCTQHDSIAALRIYAQIDVVMRMLLQELHLSDEHFSTLPTLESELQNRAAIFGEHQYQVNYNSNGALLKQTSVESAMKIVLNLEPGARVKLVSGPFEGDIGEVSYINGEGHYCIQFNHIINKKTGVRKPFMRVLGWWWIVAAAEGTIPNLPIVNIE